MEFGQYCDHNMQGKPIYHFHLIMCDAFHGILPLMAQPWESANILLQTTPFDFRKLSYIN